MRFLALAVLTFSTSSFLSAAAPFQIQGGELQRHRRRAVDYPVDSLITVEPTFKLRRRVVSYSVVQVDGGLSTTAPTSQTPTITVTQPGTAPIPTTETLLTTSVISAPASDQTVVITTTKDEILTTVTSTSAPASTLISITTTSVASPSPDAPTQTSDVINTVFNTVMNTVTLTPTPSSTAYYDDGMWHTYYPIKSFVPPTLSGPSTATNDADAQSTSAVALPNNSPGSMSSQTDGVTKRDGNKATPEETLPEDGQDVEGSSLVATDSDSETYQIASQARRSMRARYAEAPNTQDEGTTTHIRARKTPTDLKLASYNVTRTELVGAKRFRRLV